jgi:MFS transporter, NNP family, nitrate/nitrite transporter
MVMLASAIAAFLLPLADTYPLMLLAGLGVGIAGGSFAVGVSYVSRWYPNEKQGTALGIFGVGNVGAAVTTFLAPFVMIAFGWPAVAQVWAAALAVMALIFWFTTADDPVQRARRAQGLPAATLRQQLAPPCQYRSGVFRFIISSLLAVSSSSLCGCRASTSAPTIWTSRQPEYWAPSSRSQLA